MTPIEKLIILNKAAKNLRESLQEIEELYKDNKDINYYIWKIQTVITRLYTVLYNTIDKEITDEDFNKIIKTFTEETDNGT